MNEKFRQREKVRRNQAPLEILGEIKLLDTETQTHIPHFDTFANFPIHSVTQGAEKPQKSFATDRLISDIFPPTKSQKQQASRALLISRDTANVFANSDEESSYAIFVLLILR